MQKPKMILIVVQYGRDGFAVIRRVLASDQDYGDYLYTGNYYRCRDWIRDTRKRFVL